MDELLPALDVRLRPGRDLAVALRAALTGQVAHLRLEAPPLEQTKHALAVHVDGREQPILLLAEPVGFSSEGRFPLRLELFDPETQRPAFAPLLATCESLPPPSTVDDALLGRVLGGGKYKLDELLGAGATGRVYRASHLALARPLAIKVLHPFFARSPDFIERFFGEANTASLLDHVNVARTLDCGQEPDGTLYLVMELLAGQTLQRVIDERGPLEPARAINVMTQVCAALGAAHEAGVIHRDIKPDNIVLMESTGDDGAPIELVKVCDFGIAQLQGEERPGTLGQLTGTPEYMSPEQGRGEFLDARSDIYACGVVFFQALTGQVPFSASDVRVLMLLHANEPPPHATELRPDLDPRIDRLLFRCLAKERDERFPSARDLRAALQALSRPASEAPPELRAVVPLADPASGLSKTLEALSATLAQSYKSAPRALVEAARPIVETSGELTLVAPPELAGAKLFAVSGVGEHVPLDLVVGDATRAAVLRLQKWLRERRVAALTLRAGVDEPDVAPLATATSSTFRPRAALLPAAAFVGQSRKLPWPVALSLSRITHDLGEVFSDSKMDAARKREWRTRIVRDALQALADPGQLGLALKHGDLVESVVGPTLEAPFAEVALSSLPLPRCLAFADFVLSQTTPVASRAVIVALGRQLAHELTAQTEALLRALEQRALLARTDLPVLAQDWLRGIDGAALLSRDPRAALRGLEQAKDERTYARELAWLRHALPLVVQRGDASGARAAVVMLQHHRQAADVERAARITDTLAVLATDSAKRALAEQLLYGPQAQWEAARALLATLHGAADVLVVASKAGPPRSTT